MSVLEAEIRGKQVGGPRRCRHTELSAVDAPCQTGIGSGPLPPADRRHRPGTVDLTLGLHLGHRSHYAPNAKASEVF